MYPTLYRGKKGMDPEHVVTAQSRLAFHGCRLKLDGDFGAKTEDAVEQFQASHGLKPDGVIGPDTWRWLEVETFASKDESLVEARKGELLRDIDLMGPGVSRIQREALRWAVGALGSREIPDGSNAGVELEDIVDGYYSKKDVRKYGAPPWCALFTSWAIRGAIGVLGWKATPMGARFGSAAQYEKWAIKRGVWVPAGSIQPEPGAVFVMGRGNSSSDAGGTGAGHVGFVLKYTDRKCTTIDGNVRNAVSEATRPITSLRGYVNWWEAN